MVSVAAIRCAQLGMKTALIEKYPSLGGTCLNVGCIPSKALLDSTEHFHKATHDFEEHGIEVKSVKANLPKMIERKRGVVKQTVAGIDYLMKKNKITVLTGHGSFINKTTIEITKADGSKEQIESAKTIIATGSKPEIPRPVLRYRPRQGGRRGGKRPRGRRAAVEPAPVEHRWAGRWRLRELGVERPRRRGGETARVALNLLGHRVRAEQRARKGAVGARRERSVSHPSCARRDRASRPAAGKRHGAIEAPPEASCLTSRRQKTPGRPEDERAVPPPTRHAERGAPRALRDL